MSHETYLISNEPHLYHLLWLASFDLKGRSHNDGGLRSPIGLKNLFLSC